MKRHTITDDRFIKHVSAQEWHNAKAIAYLRSIAPADIAGHLPLMFDFNSINLCFSTELLVPISERDSYFFISLAESESSSTISASDKQCIVDQLDVGSTAVAQIKESVVDTFKHTMTGSINELHSRLIVIPNIEASLITNRINYQLSAAAPIPASYNIPFVRSDACLSIQSALVWLRKHGVLWCDLHQDNMMKRASDNCFVLIDFEHYIVDFAIPT